MTGPTQKRCSAVGEPVVKVKSNSVKNNIAVERGLSGPMNQGKLGMGTQAGDGKTEL